MNTKHTMMIAALLSLFALSGCQRSETPAETQPAQEDTAGSQPEVTQPGAEAPADSYGQPDQPQTDQTTPAEPPQQ